MLSDNIWHILFSCDTHFLFEVVPIFSNAVWVLPVRWTCGTCPGVPSGLRRRCWQVLRDEDACWPSSPSPNLRKRPYEMITIRERKRWSDFVFVWLFIALNRQFFRYKLQHVEQYKLRDLHCQQKTISRWKELKGRLTKKRVLNTQNVCVCWPVCDAGLSGEGAATSWVALALPEAEAMPLAPGFLLCLSLSSRSRRSLSESSTALLAPWTHTKGV